MLNRIRLYLQGDPEKKHGYYLASLLHGALMQRLDPSYVEKLHVSGSHPFSQFVTENEDGLVWTIHTLNREAYDHLMQAVSAETFESVFLEHRQETLHVVRKEQVDYSYEDLIKTYYFGTSGRSVKLKFLTPASFKQGGEYVIFPSVRLLFQSLMNRFDAFSPDNSVASEELLSEFEAYARISAYRLRSVDFSLEGVRIPGFIGEITIRINGPQQLANLGNMLLRFGEFSGVGIKSALGMGGIAII